MEDNKINMIQGRWASNSVMSNDNDEKFIHARTSSVSKGLLCLVSYVEERPWWPLQITSKRSKEKVKG